MGETNGLGEMNALEKLISELRGKINAKREFGFWEYLNQNEKLAESLTHEINGTVEENVKIDGNLLLGKNSVVKSGSRIEGNVYIGENCCIGPNAYLRNGTVLVGNNHIGICEIKNCIIFENTNIPHFSYAGDSIIGENVNFGVGSHITNLRFDNSNVTVEVEGNKVDSGRRKLGALIGSNTKIGANAVINCGKIVGHNCMIYPNKFVPRNLKNSETFK